MNVKAWFGRLGRNPESAKTRGEADVEVMRAYLEGLVEGAKETDAYKRIEGELPRIAETARTCAPYALGGAITLYGVDRLLDKDPEEEEKVPYKKWRRRLKASVLIALGLTSVGFGVYRDFLKDRAVEIE